MNDSINLKRRELLKNISLISGAAVLSGSVSWLNNLNAAEPSTGTKIKLGLIGVGSRGLYHLNILKTIPDADIVAICDDYQPSIDAAKAALGRDVKVYTNYKELIAQKDIDAVLIATPLFLHAEMTIDALQAGKHVFCEKAMAISIEQCISMVKTQKQTGLALQIGHQRMFGPDYLNALKRIKEGEIGKITQIRAFWHRNNNWRRAIPGNDLERKINWRLYLDYSRGLMTELASHHIQIANWYLGERPDYVMGSGSINYWKDGREVFDNVNLVYHYPSDVHMIYDSVISNVHYGLEAQIMGNLGTLEMEKRRIYLENPEPAPGIVQLIESVERGMFSTLPLAGSSWVPDHSVDKNGKPFLESIPEDENVLQWISFINTVRTKKFDAELLKQGYQASVACLMGHEAMMSKQTIYWKKEWDFESI